MSGTIPSMETTNNELKDNTIVIGALSLSNPSSRVRHAYPLTPAIISPWSLR